MCNCDDRDCDNMANAVALFITECGEMAEKNWLPYQVDMLKRLFAAVLKGVEYTDVEAESEE